MKIGIVGGSVGGLATALQLRTLGMNVTVLERSEQPLSSRGAGIAMPEELIQDCCKHGLFDADIPRIASSSRSFTTQQGSCIFEQPLSVMGLNWADVYSNLRKRVPDECYRKGEIAQEIIQTDEGVDVVTLKGSEYHFDYLIGADGIDSLVRKKAFSAVEPRYAGYVAWRGTIRLSEVKDHTKFENQVPYFVFPKGHILFYRIPSQDGDILLNWVMYDEYPSQTLAEFLIDKTGKPHTVSLPPGSLTAKHLSHLQALAKRVLPGDIADIVCQTQTPFLQAVFDAHVQAPLCNRICLIGDAAAVLRPHSASGVIKALKDSMSLTQGLLQGTLAQWGSAQLESLQQQVTLSINMGRALVSDTPDWDKMSPELMQQWWKDTLAGKTAWYAASTRSTSAPRHFS